jgi:sec-independent protein translocase protein TatA
MPNIGPLELIFVLVIALLLLGPKRLPAAAQSLGRSINEFRRGLSDHASERSVTPEPQDAKVTTQSATTPSTTVAQPAVSRASDRDVDESGDHPARS